MSTNPVVHNEAAHQFELSSDGETAFLRYRLKPNSILFLHTEVPEKFRGRGFAGQLASAGLDFARQSGLAVVPLCPFVASYIRKHQEYLDIVREDYRAGVLSKPGEPGHPA